MAKIFITLILCKSNFYLINKEIMPCWYQREIFADKSRTAMIQNIIDSGFRFIGSCKAEGSLWFTMEVTDNIQYIKAPKSVGRQWISFDSIKLLRESLQNSPTGRYFYKTSISVKL